MRWIPKSIVCLRQGYSRRQCVHDVLAGLILIIMGVGMVLASILFMKRMADVSNISAITSELDSPRDVLAEINGKRDRYVY